MSTIFNIFLDFLKNLVGFLPSFSLADGILQNISNAINAIHDFIVNVNFIIPLPDIVIILLFDLTIRMFKFVLFIVNWVIRRLVDAIP